MILLKIREFLRLYPPVFISIKYVIHTLRLSKVVLRKIFKYLEDKIFGPEKYESRMMAQSVGYIPDLFNPKTFNEKIAFMKIHHLIPDAYIYADKLAVRKYVESVGLSAILPKIYDSFIRPDNFNPLVLPDEYVVKANFGSGTNIIIERGSTLTAAEISSKLRNFDSVINDFFFSNEHHYLKIKKSYLVEELLSDENRKSLTDYKFHCSKGEIFMIQIDLNRHQNHTRILFDSDWNRLPVNLYYPDYKEEFLIPSNILELASIAKTLAGDLPYCRVDLYNLGGKRVVFGEITLTPGGNCENFAPTKFDLLLGNRIKLENL